METLKVKKTNGKASKDDASIKSPALKSAEKKTEALKSDNDNKAAVPEKEVKTPVMTLDQKIEKIENLKTLIEKREILEASRKKLNSFVVGANQFSENIILTDENGNKFQTSNSEVFSKVVSTINETLVSKISEIEKQIEF